jgi:hypothetical protein
MRDQSQWAVTAILKPYSTFEKLNASLQHTLPSVKINILQVHFQLEKKKKLKIFQDSSIKFPSLRPKFRIYDSEDSEEDMKPIDRYVLEDFIVDTHHFNANHKEAVTQLLSIPATFDLDYILIEVCPWVLPKIHFYRRFLEKC